MKEQVVDFAHLADSQEFRDFFAIARELTGIAVALVDPDCSRARCLFDATELNPVCRLIQTSPEAKIRCHLCDAEHCKQAVKERRTLAYECHAGLLDMVIPIFVENRHVATMVCGQLLASAPDEEKLRQFMQRNRALKLNRDALREVYFASPWIEPERLKHVERLFRFFADYFCEVGARLAATDSENKRDPIAAAKEYVRKHFRNPISLGEVADHVDLSPAYLSHRFGQVAGESFTSYLQGVRINEAQRLLRESDLLSIKVAFATGFNTITHFNRVFRRHAQTSPSAYRKTWKRKRS